MAEKAQQAQAAQVQAYQQQHRQVFDYVAAQADDAYENGLHSRNRRRSAARKSPRPLSRCCERPDSATRKCPITGLPIRY
jgi:hypothetical protein